MVTYARNRWYPAPALLARVSFHCAVRLLLYNVKYLINTD